MPTNASIESAALPLFLAALCTDVVVLALAGAILLRHRQRIAADAALLRDWLVDMWKETTRAQRIVLAFITVIAAVIRVPFLTRPLGTDEAATVLYYATQPLVVSLSVYGSPNNHLLHTMLVHFAMAVGGSSEWVIRMPAFLAGIALVPLTFVGSRLIVRDGSLIAAALVAGAPVFVDYSTDARGYTLLCCFALVAAIAMIPMIGHANTAAAILFAFVTALGFFVVPVMLYPFVAFFVWAFLRAENKRLVLVAAAAALGLTIVCYSPVLMVSGLDSLVANPYVRPLPIDRLLTQLPEGVKNTWRSLMTALPAVIQVVITLAGVVTIVRRRAWAALAGFAAVLIILLIQRTIPFPRVWLPLLLLFFVLAAAAVRLPRDEASIAIVVLVVLGFIAIRVPRRRDNGDLPHVREIARDLRKVPPATSIVASSPSDLPLAYYLHRADVLKPDLRRRHLLVVTNERYGQSLPVTLAAFHLAPSSVLIRQVHDYGESALYEVVRMDLPHGMK